MFVEGSSIVWSDDIQNIKKHWCLSMAIFESNGVDYEKILETFPNRVELGGVLNYFIENLKIVHQEGHLIYLSIPTRQVLTEKNKSNKK